MPDDVISPSQFKPVDGMEVDTSAAPAPAPAIDPSQFKPVTGLSLDASTAQGSDLSQFKPVNGLILDTPDRPKDRVPRVKSAKSSGITATDIAGDAAVTAGKVFTGAGKSLYGLADMASRAMSAPGTPSLDQQMRAFGVAPDFDQTDKALEDAFASSKYKASQAALTAAGKSTVPETAPLKERAIGELGAFWSQIKQFTSDPYMMTAKVLENLPQSLSLVSVGEKAVLAAAQPIAKMAAAEAATTGLIGKDATDFVSSKVSEFLATKGADRLARATSAATETLQSIGEAAEGRNEDMQNLKLDPVTYNLLQREADSRGLPLHMLMGPVSYLLGGVESKLARQNAAKTAGGKLEGSMGRPAAAVKGAVQEGAEETLQAPFETGGENLAKQAYDPNQNLIEGVGANAGQGLVVGAASGAGTGIVKGGHGGGAVTSSPTTVQPAPVTTAQGPAATQTPPTAQPTQIDAAPPAAIPTQPDAPDAPAPANTADTAAAPSTAAPGSTTAQVEALIQLNAQRAAARAAAPTPEQQKAALQQQAATEEADARVEAQRQAQSETQRRALLDKVLEDPDVRDPVGRYTAELGRAGYKGDFAIPSKDDLNRIRRFQDVQAAIDQEHVDAGTPQGSPNELDVASLVPEKKAKGEKLAPAAAKLPDDLVAAATAAKTLKDGPTQFFQAIKRYTKNDSERRQLMAAFKQFTPAEEAAPAALAEPAAAAQASAVAPTMGGQQPAAGRVDTAAPSGAPPPATAQSAALPASTQFALVSSSSASPQSTPRNVAPSAPPALTGAVDVAAHEAATSPHNDKTASREQILAGNAELGHPRIGGLDISIENPAGSERFDLKNEPPRWRNTMKSHYGYIRGTVGKDKDHVDVFVKPGTPENYAGPVFVVDQKNAKALFDEHKVLLGFDSEKSARAGYLENYTRGWRGLGAITQTTMDEFKDWLANGNTRRPFSSRKTAPVAAQQRAAADPLTDPALTPAQNAADVEAARILATLPEARRIEILNRAAESAQNEAEYEQAVRDAAAQERAHAEGGEAAGRQAASDADNQPGSATRSDDARDSERAAGRQESADVAPTKGANDAQLYRGGVLLPIVLSGGRRGTTLARASLDSIVEHVRAKWPNAPQITVVQNPTDIAPNVPDDANGAYWKGRVFIVASNIPNERKLYEVLAHELVGHASVMEMAGKDGFKQILKEIQRAKELGNPAIHRLARSVQETHSTRADDGTLVPPSAETEASEIIARAAEEAVDADGNVRPGYGWFKRILSIVADWLRAHNFPVRFTNLELQGLISRAGQRLEAQEPSATMEGEPALSRAVRAHGLAGVGDVLSSAQYDQHYKTHPDFAAAKAGDVDAARRFVEARLDPATIERAAQKFGPDVIYAPATAQEATGINAIPQALAVRYASAAGGTVARGIVQVNQAHHTGAAMMDRMISRPLFDGPVVRGGRYVVVDDVATSGSTLAELADHIRSQGGDVIGAAVLASASRERTITPSKQLVRELERRFGDVLRNEFHVDPASLTADEARYFAGFKDADALRNRAVKASTERAARLVAKGLPAEEVGPQSGDEPLLSRTPDWIKNGSSELQAAASKIDTYAPGLSIAQTVRKLAANWKLKLIQGTVDSYLPLKDLGTREYILARMTKGADGALEGALLYGIPKLDADGAIYGELDHKGFLGAMKELAGEHDRFLMWVAGNRADRLIGVGKENLWTQPEIDAMQDLNQGALPDGRDRGTAYNEALDTLVRYNSAINDIAEATGLIDGESRKVWENRFYVPFYRMMEDDKLSGPSKVKGLVRQYAFKRLKGGEQSVGDLLSNTLSNWSHLLSASLANQAAVAALTAAEQAGVAVSVPADTKGATFAMFGGHPAHYQVHDPFVFEAIAAVNAAALKGLPMRLMSSVKKALTYGVTISPTFRIRNLMRDTIAAVAQSEIGYNVFENLRKGFAGTSKESDDYAQMLFGGGMMRFGSFTEGDRAAHAQRMIREGIKDTNILNTPQRIARAGTRWWREYQELGDRMENVNRSALYQKLRAEGVSHRDASFQARDMMDFSLQGSWTAIRFLAQTVPFMNARAQGLYKMGRAAGDNPRRLFAVTMAVSLASIGLLLAYGDDDDWKQREEFDRDSYWWFKIGGQAYRIPKPFEVGAIGTIAERSAELLLSDEFTGKQFAERMKFMIGQTFAFSPIPQAFAPMIDVYANTDSFTQRDIESAGMEHLSKSERIAPNTSIIAQALGSAANGAADALGPFGDPLKVSPVQIDFLVKSYLGWLGTHAMIAADAIAGPFLDAEKPANRGLSDIPVIGGLLGDFIKDVPESNSKYTTMFYRDAKRVAELMSDIRHYRQLGDEEKAEAIANDHPQEIAQERAFSAAQRRMGQINQAIRRATASTELSGLEKREQIDQLTAMRNELAKTVVQQTRAE